MPRQDLTHITLVIDRSGSMQAVCDDAIGGFNAFVEQQRVLSGQATLTLIQFDDRYEEVYRGCPMELAPQLDRDSYIPRGATALYDALGRSLAETVEYVRAMPEPERPSRVVVAILTDGHENASREYTYARVHEVLKRTIALPDWKVVFLASDLDVVKSAEQMGVPPETSVLFERSPRGTLLGFAHISKSVTAARGGPVPPPLDDDDPHKLN